jgi:DNA-binding transcriptional MerR regulator
MTNENQEEIIDVEYKNANRNEDIENSQSKERIINGKPLFYTTTQVADLVGVEPSTIRFWSKRFADLLDVQISNKNKQYKESDIEKLKFIKKLTKEDRLTLQQVEEYCSSKGFDLDNIESSILDTTNPLAIQAFMAALTTEIDKKQNAFGEKLLNQIDNMMKQFLVIQAEQLENSNKQLKIEISSDVNEVVTEKLEENSKEVSNKIEEVKTSINESTEKTNKIQEENKKMIEEVAFTVNEIKETNNRLKEFLDNPELKEKLTKSVKKENNSWISKLAKKFKNE